MIRTRFTELVGCEIPLQQAGMGGLATPEMAASVTRSGAFGMVGWVMSSPEDFARRLEEIDDDVRPRIGVNFIVPFLNPDSVAVAAERVRMVEFFYDEPDPKLVEIAHAGGALACWQVGSAEDARAAAEAGCDLVVAQAVEAGGHVRGTIALLPLLDAVLGAVDVPVVAAGGIGTGRAMAAALTAGADAVVMERPARFRRKMRGSSRVLSGWSHIRKGADRVQQEFVASGRDPPRFGCVEEFDRGGGAAP